VTPLCPMLEAPRPAVRGPLQRKRGRTRRPRSRVSCRRSALQRDDPDLDAAVERAALLGAVVGDREAVAEAGDLEAFALQALADQVAGHVLGALLGDALVHRLATD